MTDTTAVRRTIWTLMIAQSSSSAGFLAMNTINAILMARLSGTDTWAGLPNTLILIGGALSAYMAGRVVAHGRGRKGVLLFGSALGATGAIIVGVGVLMAALPIYLLGLFLLGAGRGTLDQSRYAAASVNEPDQRARALSRVVWGGTIGAIIGPLLVAPSGKMAESLGFTPFAGPPFVTAILTATAGLLIFVLLHGIDLKALAQRVEEKFGALKTTASLPLPPRRAPVFTVPAARAAMVTMACGQAAMVLMMTVIGLYMVHNNHSIEEVGSVITAHVLGMYALSPVVGWLADRIGRRQTAMLGILTLACGCVFTPMLLLTPWIMFSEFLVGFGWSMCYISGSAMLSTVLSPQERAQSQGASDAIVNLAAGFGSLISGVLLAAAGFWVVAAFGLAVTLIPLLVIWSSGRSTRTPQPAQAGA